jgi:predicted amidohydrolase YtcJ
LLNSLQKADLFIKNGTVITMEDPVQARQLDIAVKEGLILAVASPGTLADLIGPGTLVLDARDQVILPGLIDSHNHMALFGSNIDSVEVSPKKVSSMTDLIAAIAERASQTPPGKWVTAWGYDDTRLFEGRHPTRKDLDRASPENPVRLMRTCMHNTVVNTLALKIAGVDKNTPDPLGGEIDRDDSGLPTGRLKEIGAMNLVNRVIPHFSPHEVARHLELASKIYASQGLTQLCEAGAGWTGNPHEASAFQLARKKGKLFQRVCLGLMEKTYRLHPEQAGTGLFTGFGDRFLWLGAAKFIGDGGIGAQTAALRKPYSGSNNCGMLCEEPESLSKRMKAAHLGDFQISIHTVGDRAMEVVLDLYESLLKAHPRPHRHRLEHAAVCPPEFIERMAHLSLTPVVQPAFLYYLGDSFVENLGPERIGNIIPVRDMIEMALPVSGSSDRPVTEGNPWTGIWSAVARTTKGGKPIAPEQCVHVEHALKMWTINGARANYAEAFTGTITPGKFADLIWIDRNPLDCETDQLRSITVSKTFIDGKQVYSA